MTPLTINEELLLLFSDGEPHTSRELRHLLVTMDETPYLKAFCKATDAPIEVLEGTYKYQRKYRLPTTITHEEAIHSHHRQEQRSHLGGTESDQAAEDGERHGEGR
jgi:hypothetical protein